MSKGRITKIICLTLVFSGCLVGSGRADEAGSESSGLDGVFGEAYVDSDENLEEDALFSDDRGVFEDYSELIEVYSLSAEKSSDVIKIPVKNVSDKKVKFYVWGEVIGADDLPYSGAIGETGLLNPEERGYLEVKYDCFGDCVMSLVDYKIEDEEGNFLVDCDYHHITKFSEPMVINIKTNEFGKEK